jgi:glycosyltransferase involved in cell wall biosynthesis
MNEDTKLQRQYRLAVLIPCYNEEKTVAQVIHDFARHCPEAEIFVFDNNSTDRTSALAEAAGAVVIRSPRQGKGQVVRHMFDLIEADIYLMVDGDSTYPAEYAPLLIEELLTTRADMVVGARLGKFKGGSFRRFHRLGNHLITRLIRLLFNITILDVLSGYRVFTREFVKSIPLTSEGFEIETELTLQSVAKNFLIREVPISYGERPEGSFSKLNTFSDGWLILKAIIFILKDFKPLLFYSLAGVFFGAVSLIAGYAPIKDFIQYGYVYHVPLAILAASIAVLGALSFSVGIILETVHRYHNENFSLWRRTLKKQPGSEKALPKKPGPRREVQQ